jgi:hypothetical protein
LQNDSVSSWGEERVRTWPVSPQAGVPEITWKVQVERSSPYFLTYHIVVTNQTSMPVSVDGRYAVLSV